MGFDYFQSGVHRSNIVSKVGTFAKRFFDRRSSDTSSLGVSKRNAYDYVKNAQIMNYKKEEGASTIETILEQLSYPLGTTVDTRNIIDKISETLPLFFSLWCFM
ncbi:MAG: hypothetical protein GWO20_02145 [Candidatus Korarchaeota archaeon]|nr:hypothetical protein [Candidatus Korarchaeota archaeon]NIU84062.1 hypothetical protein [Candidatus Thorarchaeota archaeon]NIW12777.1 hypothetical protein [Candidatus Thorarchaeota archaeon]NIW50984.1 hypothetical protein [Candidatus Korarchaeota archaeon]